MQQRRELGGEEEKGKKTGVDGGDWDPVTACVPPHAGKQSLPSSQYGSNRYRVFFSCFHPLYRGKCHLVPLAFENRACCGSTSTGIMVSI